MNYKFLIQYDGTDFHGWQIQDNQRTVQGELERVLSLIEDAAETETENKAAVRVKTAIIVKLLFIIFNHSYLHFVLNQIKKQANQQVRETLTGSHISVLDYDIKFRLYLLQPNVRLKIEYKSLLKKSSI